MIRFSELFRAKIVEPNMRNKDGMRWIVHRFPIKGGISLRDVVVIEASRPNPLLKLGRQREPLRI